MSRRHGFVCRLVAARHHATAPQRLRADFTRLANATWSFSQRYWRLVVVAMLALLHVAVFRGVADPWARALLLAHLGLLLLWQPFLRAEQRVSPTQGFILMLVALGRDAGLDWWLLAFWVVVLAGLVGGKVYQQHARWQRRCYLAGARLPAGAAGHRDPAGDRAAPRDRARDPRRGGVSRCRCIFVLIALIPAEPESAESRAGHRLLLQRVPDAAARRGDPGQLHLHDAAAHRLPGGADLYRVPDRRRRAAGRARVEPAPRLRRPERVLLALPLLDRPAGREVAAHAGRAAAARAAPGALPRRGAWRRWGACRRSAGRDLAHRATRRRAAASARRTRSSSRTARLRSPSTRATASARRCTGTCICSGSCSASSTSPSCARRSCARRATCRRCTRPARA